MTVATVREREQKLDRPALGRVIDRLMADIIEKQHTREAIRDMAWFVQQQFTHSFLMQNRLDMPPEIARQHDVYERGLIDGIDKLCAHLTDTEQLREVRGWLEEQKQED